MPGPTPAPYPFDVCLQIAGGAEEPSLPDYVQRLGQREEGAALFPGQSTIANFVVSFPCHPQSWVVAEADCRHTVLGNLRTKPRLTVFVASVVPVPWLFTEIHIGLADSSGTITWDPPALCADLSVVVQVTVANRGCAKAPASTTELTITGNSGPVASVSWPTPVIAAGGTATFFHVTQFPPPPPTQASIQACADSGGVVGGQCDTSNLCCSTTLPVSSGSGAPLLSLDIAADVVPGESPVISWSIVNDCSDLGSVTAAVFFGADKLHESAPIQIAPLGKAGEEDVPLTVPASAAAGLWAVGQHSLELRITTPGGQTFKATGQLQVNLELPRSSWTWLSPSTATWHKVYGVAGRLTNVSATAAMTVAGVTITETTAAPGVPAAGSMPVASPGSPLQPSSATSLGVSSLFQTWTWIDPWTFQRSGPTSAVFSYVAAFTITDEFGNAYPPSTSPTLFVSVAIALSKLSNQMLAETLLALFVILTALAAIVAAAGIFVLAGIYAAAAFAVWGLAIWNKAQADDPPAPDFRYEERVEVRPVGPELPRDGAPPWRDSLASVLALLERVRAAAEALGRIHAKILGARIDGASDALRLQTGDYRAVLARLEAAAAEVPNGIAIALEALEADARLSGESVDEAVEALRAGRSVDAGREAWRDTDLPDDAFDDLLERIPHFGTLPPLGQALGGIAEGALALAGAMREEADEVLSFAEG